MDLIHFQFPQIPKVHCLFGGRATPLGLDGNVSFNVPDDSALQSRQNIWDKGHPLGLNAVAECRQMHGTKMLEVNSGGKFLTECMPIEQADAMMTDQKGLGLFIKTADCQPIFLCDRTGSRIMAIHCGWRGNRACFPTLAVRTFRERYELEFWDIFAIRGPSLGYARFDNFHTDWPAREFDQWYDKDSQTLDLWHITIVQLTEGGMQADNVYNMDICTMSNASEFFSWRARKDQGRQGSLIWIEP